MCNVQGSVFVVATVNIEWHLTLCTILALETCVFPPFHSMGFICMQKETNKFIINYSESWKLRAERRTVEIHVFFRPWQQITYNARMSRCSMLNTHHSLE